MAAESVVGEAVVESVVVESTVESTETLETNAIRNMSGIDRVALASVRAPVYERSLDYDLSGQK